MKKIFALLAFLALAGPALAATAVRVNFTLNTTDANGAPLAQSRYYFVYRPDGFPLTTPLPMILIMEASPNSGAASMLNAKAAQMGFVVVSCSFSGNFTGTPGTVWNNDNPRVTGWEDFDYTDAVIARVRASENCNDAFITGISKGGHMSWAYACERPAMIKAAGPLDEFMGLTSNIATAPVPIIAFQGTLDTNVPYTMVKDSVDAWRATDGVLGTAPVTTYEASPLLPGKVTQTTWHGGIGGTKVAYVTIVGGTHVYPVPSVQTGYDIADGLWAFFSQYLTNPGGTPKIVSPPANNVQPNGQPASFWVSATGSAPLNYQWQKNGVAISGATANHYTTPPTTTADSGATYRAVVTNGTGNATSSAATLTVTAASAGPTLTTPPASQTVSAGQPVTFSVNASGVGTLSYQWLKNGVTIAGATSATFTTPGAITADSGATFRAVVTNTAGSVTSEAATLTVTPAPRAPVILSLPVRARVLVGQAATFSINAWSATPLSYQWQKGTITGNMANIPGATAATYTTPVTVIGDHLTLHRCVVSNAAGSATSGTEFLFVTAAITAPTDIASAVAVGAQAGVPFSYTIVSTGGTTPLTFSASPLPAGLSLNTSTGVISGTPTATGVTTVTLAASNSAGRNSATLALTVTATPPPVTIDAWRWANFGVSAIIPAIAGDQADPDEDGVTNALEFAAGTNPLAADLAPVITQQPLSKIVAPGAAFTVTATVSGSGNTFQWFRDGAALAGETGATLSRAAAVATDAGAYTVRIVNAAGSVMSGAGLVTVSPNASRPVNISVRAGVAPGQNLIPGFFVQGTGTKRVIVRAVGPGLAQFGVAGTMPDPKFELFRGSVKIAENDNWDGAAATAAAFAGVGAFGVAPGSRDAALVVDLAASQSYTAVVSGAAGGSGVVLVEIYDADSIAASTSRLTNVSVRGNAGTGDATLILGLVLSGAGPRTLLVRGVGPALAAFGVAAPLADPRLQIFDSAPRLLLANDDWGRADSVSQLVQATAAVGAFALAPGSRDAATLILLDPAAYTIQVTSLAAATGEALVEVYDVP